MTIWRLEVLDPRNEYHDVFLDAETRSPTGDVSDALQEIGFSVRPFFVGNRPITDVDTLADVGLKHGDLISCGRSVDGVEHPSNGVHLLVVSGADSGRRIRLPERGVATIGRSSSSDLAIDDALLSMSHCQVTAVDDGTFVLEDLGSTNGTYLEGDEITGPTPVRTGSYIHVGASVFTLVGITPADRAVLGHSEGPDEIFSRRYRSAQTAFPKKLTPPSKPSDSSSSSNSNWWRALLPLATGFGMAAITGRWLFLLIMIISPVVVATTMLRKKRRDAKTRAAEDAQYRLDLEAFEEKVVDLRSAERDRRRQTRWFGGVAELYTSCRHQRLWERSPSDEDFMSIAVGLATLASDIAVDDDEIAARLDDESWGTPLETNLLTTGSLGIIGTIDHVRAAARSLVLTLAATHSPAEVRIWILTDGHGVSGWRFARWLPHTFATPETSAIAASGSDRGAMLTQLKQIIDTRTESATTSQQQGKAAQLPVHLVVVDGTELVDSTELADLLRRGRTVGVVAVTLDSMLAPEGIGATLRLDSAASDLASFDSRLQPHCDGIMVAEMAPDVAERAARHVASLRPPLDSPSEGGVCHLVDIDDLGGLTPDALAQRWSDMSPNMVATVGMAGDIPMHVDLVRDGPHGLIGGTSGSGKTEFLKTLFTSLCLNNHPDELSIVVVDFKGGVDHDAIRPFPHVVDVATNLDISQFERTIRLLNAEQQRRQALLAEAGANNVDSYRLARSHRPDLPPLPRLMVVVDEFGELLAADGGREKLGELESITRIGRALGLHLLLVTQNFEGNLPGQIDANAGLRISLRVQKPAHSKAVLDSGVAATIPDRLIGRAYARFHGRDLTEFQTARVAGRRRELELDEADVSARIVAMESLAAAPPEQRSRDVPVEETDMHTLVQCCVEAAAASGWTRSAIPWPSSLPKRISIRSLLAHRRPDATDTPLGLVDLPSEQRREIYGIDEHVEQLAIVGGSSAPIPEILTTYAATLALTTSPDDLHLYGIDLLGSGLGALDELPHCGGVAVRDDQLALRMLRWFQQEIASRRSRLASTGSSTVWEHAAHGGTLPPRLVLLVSGADRVLSSEDGPGGLLKGPLTTLMSDGLGVRVQIVLGGGTKFVYHRLGSGIADRLVLGLADPTEYTAIGIDKSSAADLRIERRAARVPGGKIVQLAQIAPPGSGDGAIIRELAATMPNPTTRHPHRFVDLPWPLPWATIDAEPFPEPPPRFLTPLPVAIDTITGDWSWIDLVDDGPVVAVAGSPKSGRSSMLAALARLADRQGWTVVNATTSRRSPLVDSTDPALGRRCAPDEIGEAVDATTGPVLVVIDDLQRYDEASGIEAALAHGDRVLLAVAAPADFLTSRNGVMRSIPAITTGVLLAPVGALDGGAIGLRRLPVEWTSDPRPGRGIMAIAGEASEVQVPLVDLERHSGATHR